MKLIEARAGGLAFRQTKKCELTNLNLRNGPSRKFERSCLSCFPCFAQTKKMSTPIFPPAGSKVLHRPLQPLYCPLQLLQKAIKYSTARWSYLTARLSLKRAVKWYFTACQSREKQVCKEETRTSIYRAVCAISYNVLTFFISSRAFGLRLCSSLHHITADQYCHHVSHF
jgi:hypothetical protein